MKRRLLKFSDLMEAPMMMANYDKESHQMDDDDWKSRHTPDPEYKSLGTMKSGHEVVRTNHSTNGFASYIAVDHTHKIHLKVSGQHDAKGIFRVNNLTGHKKSEVKAHDFYHHLLDHFPMKSDNTHSKGGAKVWEKLSKMPDVNMKHVGVEHYGGPEKRIKLDKKNWGKNYHSSTVTYDVNGPRVIDDPETEHLTKSRFIATKKK